MRVVDRTQVSVHPPRYGIDVHRDTSSEDHLQREGTNGHLDAAIYPQQVGCGPNHLGVMTTWGVPHENIAECRCLKFLLEAKQSQVASVD